MSPEKDVYLCEKYPKLFTERNLPMQQTAMCFGFEHGDGWFSIISKLCGNIQHHIDWNRRQRASALQYNRCLKRALAGDTAGLLWYHTNNEVTEWTHRYVKEDIEKAEFREVLPTVHQVVVQQVKEKFGTLRFYYSGGDDYVRGVVDMAESMSACTCEECGAPGKMSNNGWVRVRCEEHSK